MDVPWNQSIEHSIQIPAFWVEGDIFGDAWEVAGIAFLGPSWWVLKILGNHLNFLGKKTLVDPIGKNRHSGDAGPMLGLNSPY